MSPLPEVLIWKQKECGLMEAQKPWQDSWSLIFEIWVKMTMTEKGKLHHVNNNAVKDTLTSKIISGKHLYESKLKKKSYQV